ncbi:MAG: single-stranded-DNA-specific exonuclease RecJ [Acidobacteria bacterium]|nr:single-stranded-DNA-specific exonuclease RecJ [Acidobacteriota bacterium]
MPVYEDWVFAEATPADPPGSLGVRSPQIASLIRAAGVSSEEEFRRFTRPALGDLHDPSTISGMQEACERIEAAVRAGERVVIYGDYDVDGVTSIVLLRTVLRSLGCEVSWVVPHRVYDGYGLTIPVLDRILDEQKVGLVITVDCGITSTEAVEHAIARGLDVIITDHHLPPEQLPAATVVLNPRQEGCEYPFKDLAGVGVAFKLCCELIRRAGRSMSVASLAKIAALGTIADVAPLIGENRTIVKIGLDGLASSRNHGLKALLRNLKLLGRPLRSFDVGFRIGPRINAAGRIASADTAVRLFECLDEPSAFALVLELEKMNQHRKSLQQAALEDAERQVESQTGSNILIVAGEEWHQGVVGLCAGRLAERHHRPVLAARMTEDQCIGSGRSPNGVDLHGLLKTVGHLFTKWGGHERACGFSVAREQWPVLGESLRRAAAAIEIPPRRLNVAAELRFEEIEAGFLRELGLLEPWGEGNPQPHFATAGVRVHGKREFAENCWSVELSHGGIRKNAVLWPSRTELLPSLESENSIDCAYTVESSRYEPDGVRLVIEDIR